MHRQAEIDYARIETAIAFIMDHIDDNPSLADIAGAACVSPFHFQRLFTKWAGVSPKQFIGFMRLGHAKRLLRSDKSSLLQTALGAGLSGPGRTIRHPERFATGWTCRCVITAWHAPNA